MTIEPPGFERALGTFRRAALEVPAYADFLRRNGVAAEGVQTPRDFASLPPVTKANYLRHYPLNMLAWRGDMTEAGTWFDELRIVREAHLLATRPALA